MIRPFWLIPTLLSFSRPRRSVAWSTLSLASRRYRGGHTFLVAPGGGQATPRVSSSPSPLKVSLTEDPVSVDSGADKNNNDNDGDDLWQTKALALDLPVDSFGGISYWNVDQRKSFRVVFVLGGPGAGKGTQSAFLEENFPVVHFSVGELLRAEQDKADSPHRALIQEALVAGNIVPVEISLSLLRQAMQEAAESEIGDQSIFLVDGFPRNHDNLSGWCRFMARSANNDKNDGIADLWGVLVYQCPEKVLEERILERAKDSGRSDDNLESVRKRFKTFQDQTQPIIDELDAISKRLDVGGAIWKVWNIAGDQPLADVTQCTQQMMNQLIRNDILGCNRKLLNSIEKGNVEAYQRLCDPVWFENKDPVDVMKEQEGESVGPIGEISDARMEFISGKHVIVSYKRKMEDQMVLESRVWVHKGTIGWQNVVSVLMGAFLYTLLGVRNLTPTNRLFFQTTALCSNPEFVA